MLAYHEGTLHVESVSLQHIAEKHGTPVYVYSKRKLLERLEVFHRALAPYPHLICYPVKTNYRLAILDILCRQGVGFDVASGGELTRVLRVGCQPEKIVYTCAGKSRREIEMALEVGIGSFHVESWQELKRLEELACAKGVQAPVSVRVNTEVEGPKYSGLVQVRGFKDSRFGVEANEVEALYRKAHTSPHLAIKGIHYNIGSQIRDLSVFLAARDVVLEIVDRLEKMGIRIEFVDIGGGYGVSYSEQEASPDMSLWLEELVKPIADRNLTVIVEPGRSLMAEVGTLLTRVEYIKKTQETNYVVVDTGVHHFLLPVLLGVEVPIKCVKEMKDDAEADVYDVIGPLCLILDRLGKNRKLAVKQDDLLAILCTGAYGTALSINFSSINKPVEIMVDGDTEWVIRDRETYEHTLSLERCACSNSN